MKFDEIININPIAELSVTLFDILLFLIVFGLILIILNILIQIYKKLMIHITEKTKTTFDNKLLMGTLSPLKYFSIILSLFIACSLLFPDFINFELYSLKQGGITVGHMFLILSIFGFTYLIKSIVYSAIDWYKDELCLKSRIKFDSQMIPILRKATAVVIYSIGIMIALDILGIEIGPLLAGLGIGGLAVALALQDTLSNFFAGLYMITDKPISKGDYISVDNLAGYVEEISWRNTKIKSWENNIIIIPNSTLSKSTIINYTNPHKSVIRILKISVSYDSDPDKVIKVLKKTIDSVGQKDDTFDKSMQPIVKFSEFMDSAIEFKIIYKLNDYTKRIAFEDTLKLEVFKALKKNKIEIPYPIRMVYMRDTKKR
ncbi:mechanosensitive ion channel family protein [Candidatus Micrarchaeota archaeon]|nr:mechanosensitive ion channel family protein [Candidatus Micrarchaeota archaeon]